MFVPKIAPKIWLRILTGIVSGILLVASVSLSSPIFGVLAICGILVVIAVLARPEVGLLLCAAVIPMERIGRLTPDSSMYTVSLMRIVGLLALLSFLLHATTRKWRLRFGLVFYLYLAYCGVGLVTVFFSADQLGSVRQFGALLGNITFFFLVINLVRSWPLAKLAAIVWLCASVLVGSFTIYEWHTGRSGISEHKIGQTNQRFSTVLQDVSEYSTLESEVDRAMGPTSSPAVYAINMILTIPFFYYLFRVEKNFKLRLLLVLGGLTCLYNIFLTNTRAAILLAAGVVLLGLLRGMIVMTPPRAILSVASLAAVVVFAPSAIYKRVLNSSNYSYENSATLRVRIEYWKAGLQLAEKYWLTGMGIGNQLDIPRATRIPGPEASTAHNEYLYTFLEVGVAGWTLFFSFIALLLRYGIKAAAFFRRHAEMQEQYWFVLACNIAMIATLIYALQVDVFHFPLKGWWLVAGLTVALYTQARQKASALATSSAVTPA
jgi:O-antigen ligase